MKNAIHIKDINKSFKKQKVLRNLNMVIPENSIFFLLGLNGAGKTTLMKIMLGLLYPDAGSIDFGTYNDEFGFLIESPNFYEHLSAYQNLKHHSILLGCEESEISRVLKIVRLNAENKKPVSTYSMGMKQRLGLARALMGNHDYIMLDEPLNGLDPVGMDEFKDIIKELNTIYGKTIILSSHLIKETENLATDYAIIHDGMNLLQFSHETHSDICTKLTITCENGEKELENVLNHLNTVYYIRKNEKFFVYTINEKNDITEIKEKILSQFTSCNITIEQGNLEELFLALTKGGTTNVAYN